MAEVLQLTIPGMAGRRRPSTPKTYRDELLKRTAAVRTVAGMSREEVIDRLEQLTGIRVKLATYKKWETRSPIPHHLIIPFCQAVGSEPYFLLTGVPFRLGQPIPPRHPGSAKAA